jgi:hypothetical protein
MKKLTKATQVMGLTVSMRKTKYMEVTKRPTDSKRIVIGNQQYERVKEFRYLRTTLTEDNNISTEIKQRIIVASKTSCGLKKQLYSPYLKRETKCTLYKILIRPILMYRSESWLLPKKVENLLRISERRILRRIYGLINEGGIWRIRYNNELYKLYNEPHIDRVIKIGRLRWLGHLFIMQDLDPCRKLTLYKPEGTRRVGKPRAKWPESVETDLKKMGVKHWKRKTQDRAQWRKIWKEAKVHKGL